MNINQHYITFFNIKRIVFNILWYMLHILYDMLNVYNIIYVSGYYITKEYLCKWGLNY